MTNLVDGGFGFAPKVVEVDESFDDKIQRTAVDAARRKFTPEFMNRIDKTVVFKTLRDEHLSQILDIELGMVQQRVLMAAGANQFVFNCTAKVKEYLLKEGTDPRYGARHLKRAIERNLVFPLANLVATGQVKLGDFVRIDMASEGKMIFVKEAENTGRQRPRNPLCGLRRPRLIIAGTLGLGRVRLWRRVSEAFSFWLFAVSQEQN
jgi:ATP-dependent Clp protease ATP-binding subunit ClpB